MEFHFTKMHGAGNDFILASLAPFSCTGTEKLFSRERIAFLCDRHLGIGADGLILVRPIPEYTRDELAFGEMLYYNSDGSRAEMCGNGLRCAASFAYRNNLFGREKKMTFISCGNRAKAEILDEEGRKVRIYLSVTEEFEKYEITFENKSYPVYKGAVGVPHGIVVLQKKEDWEKLDIKKFGAFLRYHPLFAPNGVNADFLYFPEGEKEKEIPEAVIRTYERGVEEETLCCGTGCSSCGVVLRKFFSFPEKLRLFCRKGDEIDIEIMKECNILKGIYLSGPAERVFDGCMTLD